MEANETRDHQDYSSECFTGAAAAPSNCLSPRLEQDVVAQRSSIVHHLPVEVLYLIFIDCMQSCLKTYQETKWPEWGTLARVSRRWRGLALSSPRLWNQINFRYTQSWVQVMLERSKQAPLEVTIGRHSSPDLEGFLDKIFANINRLQVIKSFEDYATLSIRKRLANSASPAPLLQHLHLEAYAMWHIVDVPSHFFQHSAPRLQHLEVENARLSSWDSEMFFGLTVLKLELSPMVQDIPAGKFTDALRAMKNMRELRLIVQHQLGDYSSLITADELISLPCLKILALEMPIGQASRLLKHATAPVLEHISLSVYFHPTPALGSLEAQAASLFSDLIPSMDSFCRSLPLSRLFRSTAIIGNDTAGAFDTIIIESLSHVVSHASGFSALPSESPYAPDPQMFELRIGCKEETREEVLHVLLARLPLSETLTLDLSIKPSHLALVELSRISRLESLSLDPRSTSAFLDFIVNHSKQEAPSSCGIFPALKHISITGIDFTGEEEQGLHLSTLIGMLHQREAAGAKIQRVAIHDSLHITPKAVGDMERYCEKVDWDGIELLSRPKPRIEEWYEFF